ncbi:uncharacterized protein [Lolium perenne]|uniref:uncharacterized protein n=1 Tax=Lolium perenne TaxID=4522 RepID=UPI0021F68F94|nr:uncharacterized protein LOC127336792 [Lolium perenne]
MDHLVDLLSGELQAHMAVGADEGRQMDAAEKRPAAQGGDSKEEKMWGKPLKCAEENQPEQQQNQQQQKRNKKHNHRKSRMALRKIALDKAKKSSNVEKPPTEDKAAAYLAKWAKERESEPESESRTDWHAYQARLCRDRWNESFDAGYYGTYETITSIPPMRFTDYVDASAGPRETLQIFSVRVVGVKEGVEWPLHVYGKLAVRDTVDHHRNIIFDRPRDNFQTVTEQDPYLTLTGPCRAAVLSVHHSYIEAELKIKGNSSDSSDDKDFSYLATGYIQTASFESFVEKRVLSSRLSTLELTAGHIVNSVEATIFVVVSSGKWPSGHGGAFTVSTGSMGAMEIVLLTFGDDGLPLEDGGNIRLFRRVVGVEIDGTLNLSVKASPLTASSTEIVLSGEMVVTPKEAGKSHLTMKVGSCEMEVTVAWSLLLTYDH